MDTTNASGALDPRSIRGGTTWQRRQTRKPLRKMEASQEYLFIQNR